MRVISGAYRGRNLLSPKNNAFRPTSDRAKETLFNVLSNHVVWHTCSFCDLFAGSGSVGIEALSRGAKSVTFVESGREALPTLRSNLQRIDAGVECEVVPKTVEQFVQRCMKKFSLIFADPPYAYEQYDKLLALIRERELLNAKGLLVFEHARNMRFDESALLSLKDQRVMGTTTLSFFLFQQEAAQ